jgi:hypothetical protein
VLNTVAYAATKSEIFMNKLLTVVVLAAFATAGAQAADIKPAAAPAAAAAAEKAAPAKKAAKKAVKKAGKKAAKKAKAMAA